VISLSGPVVPCPDSIEEEVGTLLNKRGTS
jgi:hypothetical protein